MQIKSDLRKELIAKRRTMQGKSAKDRKIFDKLVALPQFQKAELILTYYSTEIEVDTLKIIDYCFKQGKKVALPAIVDETMQFYDITEDLDLDNCQLSTVNCQLCIVPGLAFNKDGKRLGYGGGYYDRFLRDYPGVKIGLCYEEFIMEIPVEKHDEGVDIVIWNDRK